ncbi:hypothetical protein Fmac_015519 [Flemingia macrophylla]|uniref:DUF1508 domain-containing protein n=1 Tax=Flemingia macrophylla TaxID=520843 RepID=A0ABD1MEW4_9FABA
MVFESTFFKCLWHDARRTATHLAYAPSALLRPAKVRVAYEDAQRRCVWRRRTPDDTWKLRTEASGTVGVTIARTSGQTIA